MLHSAVDAFSGANTTSRGLNYTMCSIKIPAHQRQGGQRPFAVGPSHRRHPIAKSRRPFATFPVRATDDKKSLVSTSEVDAAAPNATVSSSAPPVPSSSSSSPSPPSASPAAAEADPDAALLSELGSMWEAVKRDVRPGLSAEEAKVLESVKIEDLVIGDTQDVMRKLAEEQLGPLLRSVGVSDDPLEFFVDLLKTATAMQLVSAGVLYYGAELLGEYDSGEAFRCVAGLAAGYLSRPFFRVELLIWPLYNWVLARIAPGAVYEVESNPAEAQATLSRLGVTVAVCSFLPQLLWGWDSAACLQFVVPLAAGWALFDVAYMAALLVKLSK